MMKKTSLNINLIYFFGRWSRNPFAAFQSLNKIVKISFLAITISLTNIPLKGYSQQDTININDHIDINEVLIHCCLLDRRQYNLVPRVVSVISKDEINASPVQSLQELLNYSQSVDVRQRGAKGVQADVSIRGGSFDQTLLLLNGIPINDPQTGHHNLNIPIDLESIERIEILEGAASRVLGPNAFTGAINIITNSKADKRIRASVCGGEHGFFNGSVSLNYNTGKLNNLLSIGAKNSNGYKKNTDFKTHQIFYHGKLNTSAGAFELQLGYLNKSFGANSFYTQKYPEQFEQVRNVFGSLQYSKYITGVKINSSLYWRRNHDRFELFREDTYKYRNGVFVSNNNDTAKYKPGNYEKWNYYNKHNYHVTDVAGANITCSFPSIIGISSLGIDLKYEHIYSNVLGNKMQNPIDAYGEKRGKFTKEANRQHLNIFIEQDYTHRWFNISGGALFHYNNNYESNLSAGTELRAKISPKGNVFASINQAMRMPTFTDLYYSGPLNVGNPDLKPELAINYELGYKYFGNIVNCHASGFIRNTHDAIDWVKKDTKEKYTTKNYTQLVTKGIEISSQLKANQIKNLNKFINYINLSYTFLDVDKRKEKNTISGYSLDYLRHKFNLTADHNIYKNLGFSWNLTFQDRNGTYSNLTDSEINYESFLLVDARLYYTLKKGVLFAEASNLFDTEYFEIGGITQPGRWITAGIKLNIEL